ncbi:MAG: hypothetical protein M9937_26345 [Chelatococcus sp.]|uniref:hypothetical protein n=1 Tax=Chelatococcus sp. TaxID=1953771 RepID=UPI00260EF42E|nr:hypothetical protein [Chelatococcus sp.]MCO5079193.1 hypothetical protein [Chelatococcus sp.]
MLQRAICSFIGEAADFDPVKPRGLSDLSFGQVSRHVQPDQEILHSLAVGAA